MYALINETITTFKKANNQQAFRIMPQVISETLLSNLSDGLTSHESLMYQNWKKNFRTSVLFAKNGNFENTLKILLEAEEILCTHNISEQCRFLITSYYCAGNPFNNLRKIYKTPVNRFLFVRHHIQAHFLFDFSTFSFSLTEALSEYVLNHLLSILHPCSQDEIKAVFQEHSISSIEEIEAFKKYKMVYLVLASKIYSFEGNSTAFLKSVKSIFETASLKNIWNTARSDFYIFCQSCNELRESLKNQILDLLNQQQTS